MALLALVFIASGFLDNIAGALIGATIARHIYKSRISLGFLAAIVAASNAGGAGSVLDDTTTTMIWIAGHSPLAVLHAYVGAVVCFAVLAVPAALAQQRHQPIQKHELADVRPDWSRVAIVVLMLIAAIGANVITNIVAPQAP